MRLHSSLREYHRLAYELSFVYCDADMALFRSPRRTQYGEDTPKFAELLLVYGRALIENAIVQNSVLGGKQAAEGQEAPKDANGAGTSNLP